MVETIDFLKAKQDRQPHLSGKARCLACKHEWDAVAPQGTLDLECPECATTRGVWKHPFSADVGQKLFVCNHCECDHFVIQPHRVICIGCGTFHQPWAENVKP